MPLKPNQEEELIKGLKVTLNLQIKVSNMSNDKEESLVKKVSIKRRPLEGFLKMRLLKMSQRQVLQN